MRDKVRVIKASVYLSAAAVMFAITFSVCFWALKESGIYSVLFGFSGAALGAILARSVYHLLLCDNSAEMWQISIYGIMADIGWVIAVFTESWALASTGLAICFIALFMLLGSRWTTIWVDKLSNAKRIKIYKDTLRYCFIDDVPDGTLDQQRPLCEIDGVPMTINEAIQAGKEEEARKAVSYLKGILEKESQNKDEAEEDK